MTMSAEGRSLELFFIDGKPDGMLTAEVFNWTGHVLMAPRTRISAATGKTYKDWEAAQLKLISDGGIS